MATTRARLFDDARVGIRLKISGLWITMLFLFAYGDIFGFFAPGNIEEIVSGEVSGIEITQGSCSRSRSTSPSPARWWS